MREGKPLKTRKEEMNMTEKMTYTKALETVVMSGKGIYSDEVIEKLEALKAQLEKRAQYKGSGKPTKAQREVAEFREAVMAVLAEKAEPVQCGELAKEMEVSGQKMSAALSKLVKEGRVVKTTGAKRVALFAVAEEEGEVEG